MAYLDLTSELSTTATEGLEIGKEEVAKSLNVDILSISQSLLPRIQNFRKSFNIAYTNFVIETKKDTLRDAINPNFQRGVKVKLTSKDIRNQAANELAQIMLQGLILLNEIRSMLTGTSIATHFYHKSTDGKIVPIKISELKPVLSLYNASGTLSNPVSLAFQMEGEIIDLSGELQKD